MQLCKLHVDESMEKTTLRPITDIIADLRAYKEEHNATQKEIAIGSGVAQSDVQRALAGSKRRVSGNLLKICKYANISVELSPGRRVVDKAYARRIQECITEIWDGSPQQGKIIVNVLVALKAALQ